VEQAIVGRVRMLLGAIESRILDHSVLAGVVVGLLATALLIATWTVYLPRN
jgi:hypothetical protein